MFENVPKVEPTPITPATPGVEPAITATQPITQPVAPESISQHEAEEQMVALFKRASLSTVQKIILGVVTVLVLGGIVGLGIWLYVSLQPFSQTSNDSTNNIPVLGDTNTTNNNNSDSQDTDGDGLSDYVEQNIYHTNPLKPDSDSDGYNDGAEVSSGHNPLQK